MGGAAMRHFRAFFYFFVGVLIALNASFAFSATSPFRLVPGGYYQYGNSVTRKYSDYNDSKKLTNIMQDVYRADSNSLGITTQFAIDMGANMMQPRVTDTYKVPINPLVDAAKRGAQRGFKGLRGGVPGVVGAVAGGLLMDILIEQGLKWNDENNGWDSQVQSAAPTKCDTAGFPSCSDYKYYQFNSGFGMSTLCCGHLLSIPSPSYIESLARSSIPSQFGPFKFKEYIYGPYNYVEVVVEGNAPSILYGARFLSYNDSKPSYSEPKDYAPITDSQLNDAIKRAIESSMLPFVDALQQDGTPIEVDESTQAITVGDAAISQPKTTTSTQINPDGSRTTENKTTTLIATPVGTGTIGGDIGVSIEEQTQITTNNCAADGTCDVTEKTETKTDAPVSECQPNSTDLKCAGLGDPPDSDIPSSQKNVSLTPYAFNMTAVCPAPVQFTVRNQLYSVSYQPICDFAGFIKALVLISAVVTAYFICFGTRREGN